MKSDATRTMRTLGLLSRLAVSIVPLFPLSVVAQSLPWNPYRSCTDHLLTDATPKARLEAAVTAMNEGPESRRTLVQRRSDVLFESLRLHYEKSHAQALPTELVAFVRRVSDLRFLIESSIFQGALSRTFYRFGIKNRTRVAQVLRKLRPDPNDLISVAPELFADEFIEQLRTQIDAISDLFLRSSAEEIQARYGVNEAEVAELKEAFERFAIGDEATMRTLVLEQIGALDSESLSASIAESISRQKAVLQSSVKQRDDALQLQRKMLSHAKAPVAKNSTEPVSDLAFKSALTYWKARQAIAAFSNVHSDRIATSALFTAVLANIYLWHILGFEFKPKTFGGDSIAFRSYVELTFFLCSWAFMYSVTDFSTQVLHEIFAHSIRFPIALERLSREQLLRLRSALEVVKTSARRQAKRKGLGLMTFGASIAAEWRASIERMVEEVNALLVRRSSQ